VSGGGSARVRLGRAWPDGSVDGLTADAHDAGPGDRRAEETMFRRCQACASFGLVVPGRRGGAVQRG
jgi:hypothetical protein